MKKNYIFGAFVALLTFVSLSVFAQPYTDMPAGFLTTPPAVSTAESPVWYNMMSTNGDERKISYMYFDGTNFKTEQILTGITDAMQSDKYMWRLEVGTKGPEYVVFVHKTSGARITGAALANNSTLTMGETGVEWYMRVASAVPGSGSTTNGQYCFNYNGPTPTLLLNAGIAADPFFRNVLVFDGAGSVAKSSGWFFYPVTSTKTVTINTSENGTVTATATNGTPVQSTITTGNSVLVGTKVTVSVSPATGFVLQTLTVNGNDVTASLSEGKYSFNVNTDATVEAVFTVSTINPSTSLLRGVYMNPQTNHLTFFNRVENSEATIYNVTGKRIAGSNASEIDLSDVQAGVYFVRYMTSTGVESARFIKK
jgi:hypothetical protein